MVPWPSSKDFIFRGYGQRALYLIIRGVTTVNVISFLYVGESRRNRPFVFVLIFSRLSTASHYLSKEAKDMDYNQNSMPFLSFLKDFFKKSFFCNILGLGKAFD